MKKQTLLKLAATIAFCVGAVSSQAQITNGLVVHYTFDSTNASGVYTSTVPYNSIVATPVGSPTPGNGKIGKCVALTVNGTNSLNNFLTLGYPPELHFADEASGSDFSIAFWCNYTNQTSDPPFIASQNWNSSQNPGWGIYMQGDGNFRVACKDDSNIDAHRANITPGNPAALLRDGQWHHVVVTFKRTGVISLYKDGALLATTPLSQCTGNVDTDGLGNSINIGQDGTGNYQAGSFNTENVLMDDLGIWARELSASEISSIYNSGLGGTNIANVPTIANPYLKSTSPAFGQLAVSPGAPISAVITDGTNALSNASIVLKVNGTQVTPSSITKNGSDTIISYTNSILWTSGVNTATIIFSGSGGTPPLITNNWNFTVAPYTTLTPAMQVSADTSKPGFKWNIFANQNNTTAGNARSEAALAGQIKDVDGITPLNNLADPAAQGVALAVASAPSPANAAIKFDIAGPLNQDSGASGTGDFMPDGQMPGLPSTDSSSSGAAAEAITYITLPAGLVSMGINSADGFRTTAGSNPLDVTAGIRIGEFDGARSASDSIFYMNVLQAGTYAFRTLWGSSTGGANIEWFIKTVTTNVLVNDIANGGPASYRALTTPIQPYVKYVSPDAVQRVLNQPNRSLVIVISDGTVALDDNSISLKLDGSVITPTKSRAGSLVTLAYTPSNLQCPGDSHLAELSFSNVGGTFTTTNRWSFFNLRNIVLPAPALTENFDSYAEGLPPTGWNAVNFTDCSGSFCQTPGADLDNLSSDTYRGWTVVSRSRLETLKSGIFQIAPGQTRNGVDLGVDDLSTGNLIYAESDSRDGYQVQFIKSSPFNLSAVANPVLSFGSLYEQNQNNGDGVEYSVDGGNTWMPVVYYLDEADSGGDIRLHTDTTVDAVKTFTDTQNDTARWVDNGVQKGGNYGDPLLAPITQALGRFVYPRENDNANIDKRFEVFRLPAASHKSDVRLRFFQIGNGSWYFGVDNIAFYDAPAPPPVVLSATKNGTIYWTGTGTLFVAPSLNGPWTVAPSQTNPQTVTIGVSNSFYRIAAP